MPRIAADMTWLIGRTPLVALKRVAPASVNLVAKLEAWSPSGGNKDRAVLGMIRHAERSGFLKAGGTVVECSSGDLGMAVATIGSRIGYRVVLTMPDSTPAHRQKLLRSLGAEVVTSPSSEGMRGAMALAEKITKETPGAICLQAFTNRANARAQQDVAREIWDDTDGGVGLVVVPVGTGGTAAGCLQFFREVGVPVAAVQPAASPVLTGGRAGPHSIPGLGAGFVPEILVPDHLAAIVDVADEDAIAMTRRLLREEGLLVGPASGAVLHGALLLAHRPQFQGAQIVAVLPDRAERNPEHACLQEPKS